MELGSLIGLIGGIAVLLYGMLTGGELSSFLDVPSIVVTMGVPFSAILYRIQPRH